MKCNTCKYNQNETCAIHGDKAQVGIKVLTESKPQGCEEWEAKSER